MLLVIPIAAVVWLAAYVLRFGSEPPEFAGRLEQHPSTAAVDDQRHPVVGAQASQQQVERPLHQHQAPARRHRARDVDHEDQVHRRSFGGLYRPSTQVEAQQMVAPVLTERRPRSLGVDREVTLRWRALAVVEGVDVFLDPHCLARRQVAVAQVAGVCPSLRDLRS